MAIRPWLENLSSRLTSARKRSSRKMHQRVSVLHRVESYEDRAMLTSTLLFLAGELQVLTDANENVAVRQDPSNANRVQVLINGTASAALPALAPSQVLSLVISTGDSENNVDVSGLTAAAFANLASITIDTGNGNDVITGSDDFAENIDAGDGNDIVDGRAGNDTLDGNNGNDTVTGGTGSDVIRAGDGLDSVFGGDGDDTIDAGDGNDSVSGDVGNDSINGGDGVDTISGGAGSDFISSDLGNDSVNGDAGDDTMLGGGGNDTLSGDVGNDFVTGNGGQDSLLGGDGSDTLSGKQGADSVFGGAGNDFVNGDEGNDLLEGGADDDLMIGGSGDDLMRDDGAASAGGTTSADTMLGNSGNDTLIGLDGTDSVVGGAGNDLVDMRRITVSIDDVRVAEGDTASGSAAVFTVTLSSASSTPVSVNYSTSSDGTNTGGTAIAGTDYTAATSQVLTFAPGQVSQTISIGIIGDSLDESDEETFFVNLTGASNAAIFDGLGEGRILDDDSGVSSTVADIILLFDDTSSFSLTGPTVTGVFQNVVSDLITNFPASDFAFGVARFESYFGFGDKPYVLNQPLISSTTPNFNAALNAALARNSPGGGAGAETLFEALHQISTGAGYDGNGDGDTTGDGPAGLVSTQTGNGVEDDVPAYSTFQPDPTGPVLSPTAPVASATDGIGLRPGARHIVLVASDSGNFVFQADNATTYTGVNGSSVPASTFLGTQSPAGGNQATIQATLNELIADNVEVIGLYDPAFFGTNTAVELTALATLTGAINRGTSTIESGITPGPSGDDIAPNQPLYFQIDSTNPNQLRTAIVQAVTGAIGNVTPPPPPPSPPPVVNLGPQQDTINGDDGADTLFAADSADVITGGIGDDFIQAGGGNDSVYGGSGNDTIDGQDGDDFLQGQGGNDSMIGGAGDDTLVWKGLGQGNDTVNGGDGQDGVQILGSTAGNTLSVGASFEGFLTVTEGSQSLTVQEAAPSVTVGGGGGDDTITIGDLSKLSVGLLTINGDAGNDLIDATGAKYGQLGIRLNGGDGDDVLKGGVSAEIINGDAGQDIITAGSGNDTVDGGTGADFINGDAGDDSIAGGSENDTINGGAGNDSLDGGLDNDSLSGGDGNDTAVGGFGNDTMAGEVGNDSLSGGLGSDAMSGGVGNDTVDGGRNDDTISGDGGHDRLLGDHGNDVIGGGSGDDTILGGDGDDTITGGIDNDLISGGDGNDFVHGDSAGAPSVGGRDTLIGGDGNDVLVGGLNADVLLGQQGDDYLGGQGGTDLAAKGGGADTTVSIEVIDETYVLSAALLAALNGT